jgi:hypothetical protein
MLFDGAAADRQNHGDLAVAFAGGDPCQHVCLAPGQRRKGARGTELMTRSDKPPRVRRVLGFTKVAFL